MKNLFDELRFHTSAAALVDQWLDLRVSGQSCPFKKDFSPMRMGKTLPDIFMVEWKDDDHVIIRVAGSRTSDVTQDDMTGENMLDIVLPEHRLAMKEFYRKMRTGIFAGVTEHALSKTPRPSTAKGLQLPLLSKSGELKFFVGATKVVPIEKNLQDFRAKTKDSPVSLNVWFTDLDEQLESVKKKIV